MTVTRAAKVVPTVVFLGAFALMATGRLAPDWPVVLVLLAVALIAGAVQRRHHAAAREEREVRLGELAASHGLQVVEPPHHRGIVRSLQGAALGDASVNLVDPDRDSPSWQLLERVLPSGSISCRFLAVGERDGRPLRLSVERTTTTSGNSRNRSTKVRRSVAVATRVDVDGSVDVRPSGRAWQAIGGAIGRAFGQRSRQVGLPEFDDAYAVTGDGETVQAVLDPATASRWSGLLGDATVAVGDGWLAAARTVPLDADETAATADRLLAAVTELAGRLSRL